jgi:transcriptional regulator with XRE-family HTH domain
MDQDKKRAELERFQAQVEREKDFLEGISAAHGAGPDQGPIGPLGDRVKRIRESNGLSLQDVASRTGFSTEYLEKIENNQASPALGALIKLGRALDMKMGYFISGGESNAYTVVRADERRKISRRANVRELAYGYTYQSLAPGKTNRHMEPFLVTLQPSEEDPLSSHDGQEFIFVLEGKMEAIIDQDRVLLNEGDAIYYDSSVPHVVRCAEGPHTKILAVLYAEK